MRKIEEQMIEAIEDGKSWRSGNTSVAWSDFSWQDYAEIRLHGNRIAELHRFEDGRGWQLHLHDAGWQTATTKSRLNALLAGLVHPMLRITQRDYEWFLHGIDGGELRWPGSLPFDAPMLNDEVAEAS